MDCQTLSNMVTTNVVQTSPLLDLPGELRNHIFGFIIEDGALPSSDTKFLASKLDPKIAKSTLLPALQTCQQLRTEFKGFLSSMVEFFVEQSDMTQICQYWVLGGGVNGDATKAHGNFAINILKPQIDHDVLPILRTYLAANTTQQNLNFRYYTSQPDEPSATNHPADQARIMNRLLSNSYIDLAHKNKWHNFLNINAKHIYLPRATTDWPTLDFVVQREWLTLARQTAKAQQIFFWDPAGNLSARVVYDDQGNVYPQYAQLVAFWEGIMGFNVLWAYKRMEVRAE